MNTKVISNNMKKNSQEEIEAQESRMIDLGLEQIAQGKVMSHEEARSKIKKNLLSE